jgi:cytochrome c556
MLQGLPPYLPGLFVEGSSTPSAATRGTLPVIWSDNAGFLERFETLTAEVDQLVAVAGDGRGELGSQVARVGEACSACHNTYRAR